MATQTANGGEAHTQTFGLPDKTWEFLVNAILTRSHYANTSMDARRDIYKECGFPDSSTVDAKQYKSLYDREAIATRVVEAFPKESWQGTPDVYEDEDPDKITAFEQSWLDLSNSIRGKSWHQDQSGNAVWEYLLRADILSGIGTFGILLIGINDGKDLREPVDAVMKNYIPEKLVEGTDAQYFIGNIAASKPVDAKGTKVPQEDEEVEEEPEEPEEEETYGEDLTGIEEAEGTGAVDAKPGTTKILFLRAFDESLVQITQWEGNKYNPRYGQPVMYQVTLNDPDDQHAGIGMPLSSVDVHWTRVIHLADNLGNSEIFGAPRQRPVLNNILNIQKISGASGEGFWRGCFMGLSLETHPQLGGDVTIDAASVRTQLEQWMNSMQRYLAIPGMHANPLAPQVVDPTPQINAQIDLICIRIEMPKRVFMGSERGELASSQDDSTWNDRKRERQEKYITPRIIVPFVDRLIMMGVLPEPAEGYSVVWPDLDELGAKDQAAVAMQRTQALAAYVSGQVEALMSPLDYLTIIMGMTDEEAQSILETTMATAPEDQLTIGGPTGQVDEFGNPIPPEEQQFDEEGNPIEPEEPEDGEPIEEEAEEEFPFTQNVFCKTGEGGGVDPTCGGSISDVRTWKSLPEFTPPAEVIQVQDRFGLRVSWKTAPGNWSNQHATSLGIVAVKIKDQKNSGTLFHELAHNYWQHKISSEGKQAANRLYDWAKKTLPVYGAGVVQNPNKNWRVLEGGELLDIGHGGKSGKGGSHQEETFAQLFSFYHQDKLQGDLKTAFKMLLEMQRTTENTFSN